MAQSIALLEGDPERLRDWLEAAGAYDDKARFYEGPYAIGQYDSFFEGFPLAMKERSRWLQVPLFMQRFPDHWQTLQNWALADSALTSERLDRINQHRALIERITRHMVL